jgi:hypothetical protein
MCHFPGTRAYFWKFPRPPRGDPPRPGRTSLSWPSNIRNVLIATNCKEIATHDRLCVRSMVVHDRNMVHTQLSPSRSVDGITLRATPKQADHQSQHDNWQKPETELSTIHQQPRSGRDLHSQRSRYLLIRLGISLHRETAPWMGIISGC